MFEVKHLAHLKVEGKGGRGWGGGGGEIMQEGTLVYFICKLNFEKSLYPQKSN